MSPIGNHHHRRVYSPPPPYSMSNPHYDDDDGWDDNDDESILIHNALMHTPALLASIKGIDSMPDVDPDEFKAVHQKQLEEEEHERRQSEERIRRSQARKSQSQSKPAAPATTSTRPAPIDYAPQYGPHQRQQQQAPAAFDPSHVLTSPAYDPHAFAYQHQHHSVPRDVLQERVRNAVAQGFQFGPQTYGQPQLPPDFTFPPQQQQQQQSQQHRDSLSSSSTSDGGRSSTPSQVYSSIPNAPSPNPAVHNKQVAHRSSRPSPTPEASHPYAHPAHRTQQQRPRRHTGDAAGHHVVGGEQPHLYAQRKSSYGHLPSAGSGQGRTPRSRNSGGAAYAGGNDGAGSPTYAGGVDLSSPPRSDGPSRPVLSTSSSSESSLAAWNSTSSSQAQISPTSRHPPQLLPQQLQQQQQQPQWYIPDQHQPQPQYTFDPSVFNPPQQQQQPMVPRYSPVAELDESSSHLGAHGPYGPYGYAGESMTTYANQAYGGGPYVFGPPTAGPYMNAGQGQGGPSQQQQHQQYAATDGVAPSATQQQHIH